MTTRRSDKTRKPPRRPPVRTAARTNGASQSVQGETAPVDAVAVASAPEAIETTHDTVAETAATAETALADQAEPARAQEVLAQEVSAQEELVQEEPVREAAPEPVAETEPAGADDVIPAEPVAETAEAPTTASDEVPADVEAARDGTVAQGEAIARDTGTQDVGTKDIETDAAASPEPVAASQDAPVIPAATEPASAAEAAGRPGAEQEPPLAAMQGFIEINGRLVAFLQGEGQAAVAFWKAALTVRSPGDLAQLQAAEVSRAIDAALACWTDLARRMGRLASAVPPQSRAA